MQLSLAKYFLQLSQLMMAFAVLGEHLDLMVFKVF